MLRQVTIGHWHFTEGKYLIGQAGRWAAGIGVIGTPLDRIIIGGDRIGQDRGWAGNAKHRFRVNTTSTRFGVRFDDMGFAIYNGVFRVKVTNFFIAARGDACLIGLLKLHGGYTELTCSASTCAPFCHCTPGSITRRDVIGRLGSSSAVRV